MATIKDISRELNLGVSTDVYKRQAQCSPHADNHSIFLFLDLYDELSKLFYLKSRRRYEKHLDYRQLFYVACEYPFIGNSGLFHKSQYLLDVSDRPVDRPAETMCIDSSGTKGKMGC